MWTRNLVIGCVVSLLLVSANAYGGFVETRGSRFELDGKPFYFNGFNSYWLMYMASDPTTKDMVTDTFAQASRYGMTVARTWAFSDGGYRALQSSPGVYNEDMFKGLDFVISEARKYGIRLILSLVNNWEGFGGKKQYVQWARDRGQYINNEDDFFRNPIVKGYYKDHIKAVLTRKNSISGVAYRDDPTIFAWELMNEPRCQSDLSGRSLQEWASEMSAYVKSLDPKHLLEIGLEGFYGESTPQKKLANPGYEVGTDFIANNRLRLIDFATIHLYPDQWMPGSNDDAQAAFVDQWIGQHISDCKSVLGKPLVLTEFGRSSRTSGYTVGDRDSYFGNIYSTIYSCARTGGPCGGALFWQVMAPGMDNWSDGYDVVFNQSPSTDAVISLQSDRIAALDR
ncbi:putative mannan endo-1,4-beta-mannosidase 9 [Andrographis paniculata]|uniref:putative mannan endo-1,4-beta-mannosidase 9 n=1 Tax=Andrographis paniculata TaxID=175694 RepID=UPI0021E8659F|nr:putative mannan endo-1,4-beta-mannosidase 9 [Andrographis paniculata]